MLIACMYSEAGSQSLNLEHVHVERNRLLAMAPMVVRTTNQQIIVMVEAAQGLPHSQSPFKQGKHASPVIIDLSGGSSDDSVPLVLINSPIVWRLKNQKLASSGGVAASGVSVIPYIFVSGSQILFSTLKRTPKICSRSSCKVGVRSSEHGKTIN